MQQTLQMHLNTDPTCLEGPEVRKYGLRGWGQKIRFRDPGPENEV